jgi:hypothetical protein
MSEHINSIIGAYLDGELHGRKLELVEKHLESCETCRRELAAQQQISYLLQDAPLAESLMPVERFVSQVGLQLTQRQAAVSPAKKTFEIGWWLIPAGITVAWTFLQTTTIVSSLFSLVLQSGLPVDNAGIQATAQPQGGWVTTFFSLSDLFLGDIAQEMLQVLAFSESLGWNLILNAALMALLGIFLWSWLATWWLRQRRSQSAIR